MEESRDVSAGNHFPAELRDVGVNLAELFLVTKTPNKAPEPTPTAVTPRAIVRFVSNVRLADARAALAVVVAHL